MSNEAPKTAHMYAKGGGRLIATNCTSDDSTDAAAISDGAGAEIFIVGGKHSKGFHAINDGRITLHSVLIGAGVPIIKADEIAAMAAGGDKPGAVTKLKNWAIDHATDLSKIQAGVDLITRIF